MTTPGDQLDGPSNPDRVAYALGTLLSADDFRAEQNYHRGRLARALAMLHGSGTIAGLKVEWKKAVLPSEGPPRVEARPEELEVFPGVALDRLGRLVEVPRTACLRLGRWYDQQSAADLIAAAHTVIVRDPATGADVSVRAVVADLFVSFLVCERGLTPAFAAGPFDALDAVAPSRLRDGYALALLLRKEAAPPVPASPWNERDQLLEDILGAWDRATEREEGRLKPLAEHIPGQDPTAVLLARVAIVVEEGGGAARPARRASPADPEQRWVFVDNAIRPLVYSSGALARATGL